MRERLRALLLLLLGLATGAQALNFQEGRLQVHGFASQALVKTSDNNLLGDSTGTSFDFSELGLNASYRINPRLLLSGQALLRHAGEMYAGDPSLDYGLLDATLISSSQRRLGLRLGRFKSPLGLYNETRDVPFARPGLFLPQSIYYDKVRNLMLSTDGLMLYDETSWNWGALALALGAGEAVIDENVEWAFLGSDYGGELEPDGAHWLASAWLTSPTERFKLGLSLIGSKLTFDTSTGSLLEPGEIDFTYGVGSAQYNAERWSLAAEYMRTPLEWRRFGPGFPFQKETMEGYYLQAGYRLTPVLELMMRYEEGYADRNDRDGTRSSALTGGFTPPFDFYSKIWTTGLRWDIKQNLMLRLEYQRHHGTFALSIRENRDPNRLVEDWDAFAASISVRF